jgi:predicted DNA-binding transcriptional regulator YafY
MQTQRLFEMTYLLLSRRSMTAKELAERFEVSERTVYRDVDALSAAGIPVYAAQGKGGGIRLLENFVLDRSVLSEAEQREILSALRGLAAVHMPDMDRTILEKLGGIFRKETVNWVDIDFSGWEGRQERNGFRCSKKRFAEPGHSI